MLVADSRAQARDADSGQNAAVRYSLMTSSPGVGHVTMTSSSRSGDHVTAESGQFSVDEATGDVRLTSSLDRELTQTVQLTVCIHSSECSPAN